MGLILLWLLVSFLLLAGLAGILIPGIPGLGLIFIGILVYGIGDNFIHISQATVIIFGIIALLGIMTDYFGGAIGAKVAGGGRYALFGSVIGAVVGFLVLSYIGLLIGSFLGTLLGALYEGHSVSKAKKIALLTLITTIGATTVQLLTGIFMIFAFILALII